MAYGFRFAYRLSGGEPTIQRAVFQDTETLTKGDMINLESGKADLAVTTDSTIAGVALETVSGTTNVTYISFISDADAVYAVDDANARLNGALLDISGATGAQTVASSSGNEFQVVADSSATEPTLVIIDHGDHYQN
jgi:hypothetical protein